MPTPNQGESRKDYVERCIPIVLDEGTAESGEQAAAICNSMWERHKSRSAMSEVHVVGLVDAASIRSAKFQGRDHLVVPVVAMVGGAVIRGVGSRGNEFVPSSVIALAPAGWDGRPVLPGHPNGGKTLANDPVILESYQIGRVFNSRFEEDRLKMEAWLDVARCQELGGDAAQIIERCQAGEVIEVSVGALVAVEDVKGTSANGDPYDFIWSFLVPDHLAMLAKGTEGACSIETGCGAPRAAQSQEVQEIMPDTVEVINTETAPIVPETRATCTCSTPSDGTAAPLISDERSTRMITEKVKNLAGRLIACTRSPFQESDRPALESFSEDTLAALVVQSDPPPVEPPKVEEPKPLTEEEQIAALPERLQRLLADAAAREAAEHSSLVTSLVKAQDAVSEASLKAKPLDELRTLAKMLKVDRPAPVPDYSGLRIPTPPGADNTVPAPTSLFDAVKARQAS